MWPRLTFYDVRVIGHYLGVLIMTFTIGLAVPFVTALLFAEWEAAARYLTAMGITLIVGSALRFMRIQPGRLQRNQALMVTGLAWIILGVLAAVPLYFSGHYLSYMDALFEGVSGLTTTGASTVVDLDHLSYADNMWRFAMHFIGGLGLVVVGLTFGLFGKGGGGSLFASEGHSEHVVPNVMQTTRFILKIAIVFVALSTLTVSIVCISLGMEPVRGILQALWISISAFMTAGFTPMSQSIMYYHSQIIEVATLMVMLLGTINFSLHSQILNGNVREFFNDMEVKMGGVWLVVIVVVFAASLSGSATFSDLPAMVRRGTYMVVSAFSTTGFQNVTQSQLIDSFSSGAFLVLAILMAVGSTSGSTAGGIKLNRLVIIVKSVVAALKRTLSPDSARVVVSYYHLGRRTLTSGVVGEAMTVTALYAVTYIIGALVGIAHGYEASQAIFESIAMASNGGISSGVVAPGMPISLETFYIFEMWAGRLEFVTLMALVVQIVVSATPRSLPDWWTRRRAERVRR